jgi:hypothetical protein
MQPNDDSLERFLAKVRFKADGELPDELNARCDFMETAMDVSVDYELKEWMKPEDTAPVFSDLKRAQLVMLNLWNHRQEALGKFMEAAEDSATHERETFGQLCALLNPLLEQHPDDPLLQRWMKLRDEWAKDLPPS